MIRTSMEDTSLTVPNPMGENGSKLLPVPKGIRVSICVICEMKLLPRTHQLQLTCQLRTIEKACISRARESISGYTLRHSCSFEITGKRKYSRSPIISTTS